MSNDKVYTVRSARAFLLNSSSVPGVVSTSTGKAVGEVTFNNANPDLQFRIEKSGSNYYLYSIGAGKYVNKSGSYVESPSDALSFEKVSGDYPWKLCLGGNGMNSQVNGQTDSGIIFNGWTTTDEGNCYMIEVVKEKTYSIGILGQAGQTIKIGENTYKDGDTYTVLGAALKSNIIVEAPKGMFSIVAIDDAKSTITVSFVALSAQPITYPYTVPVLYPMQQEAVGVAECVEKNGVYTLSNKVLAASYVRVGDAIYFAGSEAMDLVGGTEPFTVAFGSGDNVPASAMTLKDLYVENLVADETAIGGAEHFAKKITTY